MENMNKYLVIQYSVGIRIFIRVWITKEWVATIGLKLSRVSGIYLSYAFMNKLKNSVKLF